MILSTPDGQLQMIRQPDHGELSGELAEHWGNEVFDRPEPFGPMVLAAALHDNGWEEWDNTPKVNPQTLLPYQFTEMPVQEHLTFYWRGVERVIAKDRYAGLMVSMHCAGLYNGRYGTDPALMNRERAPDVKAIVQGFTDRLEAQQRQLRTELAGTAEWAPYVEEKHLWTNYRLLQMYDRLSLFLCMPPLKERSLGPTPTRYDGKDVEFRLLPFAPNGVRITPYPFRESPLAVSVKARVIPNRPYAQDAELGAAFDRAEPKVLEFILEK